MAVNAEAGKTDERGMDDSNPGSSSSQRRERQISSSSDMQDLREDFELVPRVPFPLLAGETVWKSGRCKDGLLLLTNYRLFMELGYSGDQPPHAVVSNSDTSMSLCSHHVPLGLIEQVEQKEPFYVVIVCKDARTFRCGFDDNASTFFWYERLSKAVEPPQHIEQLFAFYFCMWSRDAVLPAHIKVARRLHPVGRPAHNYLFDQHWFNKERVRMRFTGAAWRITEANVNYALCPSYPPYLIVPSCISDEQLVEIAKFRHSRRIIAVVWRHRRNGAVLARSSQPAVGWLGWRSTEDEDLMRAITDACNFDAHAIQQKRSSHTSDKRTTKVQLPESNATTTSTSALTAVTNGNHNADHLSKISADPHHTRQPPVVPMPDVRELSTSPATSDFVDCSRDTNADLQRTETADMPTSSVSADIVNGTCEDNCDNGRDDRSEAVASPLEPPDDEPHPMPSAEALNVLNRKILIIDARSYAAAVANRTRSGGCECPEYYPNCEIKFMNLANIHYVRRSFLQLRALYMSSPSQPNFYSQLESTRWLFYISELMKAAVTVVTAMERDARPVLVHCSDGWDRTPQIVSLAELLMDPYYRTIEGFCVLTEREWLAFGHKFAHRSGQTSDNVDERCPVFLQWLDCVHQLICQFPCAFEFSAAFLVKLAHHVYSNLFGTFLCNTMEERLSSVVDKTFSVWRLLDGPQFRNYLYAGGSKSQPSVVAHDRGGAMKGDVKDESRIQQASPPTNDDDDIWSNVDDEDISKGVLWPLCNVRDLHLWHDVYLGRWERPIGHFYASLGNETPTLLTSATTSTCVHDTSGDTSSSALGETIPPPPPLSQSTQSPSAVPITRSRSDESMSASTKDETEAMVSQSTTNAHLNALRISDTNIPHSIDNSNDITKHNVENDADKKSEDVNGAMNRTETSESDLILTNSSSNKSAGKCCEKPANQIKHTVCDAQSPPASSDTAITWPSSQLRRSISDVGARVPPSVGHFHAQRCCLHTSDRRPQLNGNYKTTNLQINGAGTVKTDETIFDIEVDDDDDDDGDIECDRTESYKESDDEREPDLSIKTSTDTLTTCAANLHITDKERFVQSPSHISGNDQVDGIAQNGRGFSNSSCTNRNLNSCYQPPTNSIEQRDDSPNIEDHRLSNDAVDAMMIGGECESPAVSMSPHWSDVSLMGEIPSLNPTHSHAEDIRARALRSNLEVVTPIALTDPHPYGHLGDDGLLSVRCVTQERLWRLIHGYKRREEALQKELHIIRQKYLDNICHRCNNKNSGGRGGGRDGDRHGALAGSNSQRISASGTTSKRHHHHPLRNHQKSNASRRVEGGFTASPSTSATRKSHSLSHVNSMHRDAVNGTFTPNSTQQHANDDEMSTGTASSSGSSGGEAVSGAESCRSDMSWEALEGAVVDCATTTAFPYPEVSGTLWVPDHAVSKCTGCQSEFWVGKRKHHCRKCGRIFCADCSRNSAPLPSEHLFNPVRICKECYANMTIPKHTIQQMSYSVEPYVELPTNIVAMSKSCTQFTTNSYRVHNDKSEVLDTDGDDDDESDEVDIVDDNDSIDNHHINVAVVDQNRAQLMNNDAPRVFSQLAGGRHVPHHCIIANNNNTNIDINDTCSENINNNHRHSAGTISSSSSSSSAVVTTCVSISSSASCANDNQQQQNGQAAAQQQQQIATPSN